MRRFTVGLGIIMSLLYATFGIFILLSPTIMQNYPNYVRLVLGAALLLYAIWRAFRIYKKITEKDTDEGI
jgi:4-amino-4-deoxy-L-arabinose transferase-like glycosyltransferase